MSSTAARAPGGQQEEERGVAVGFTAEFPDPVSRRSLRRGDRPLLPLFETCLLQLSHPLKGQKGLPQVGVPLALLLTRPVTDAYSRPRHKWRRWWISFV